MKMKKKEKIKQQLTSEQKRVLLEKGTEAPFTGKFLYNKEQGIYQCAQCGTELFSSQVKFYSGTGWPSFTEAKNVELKEDNSLGMHRVEVLCKKCKGHLGHMFNDGPDGKKRFCINSCVLGFKKKNIG